MGPWLLISISLLSIAFNPVHIDHLHRCVLRIRANPTKELKVSCKKKKSTLYLAFKYKVLYYHFQFSSFQFSRLVVSDSLEPMNLSTPGLLVHQQLPEFTQIRVHQVCDAIQPSHPQLSPSSPAPNPSQHQSLFQWVNSSHEVAKVRVQLFVTPWTAAR